MESYLKNDSTMIENLIDQLVENPTEEYRELYSKTISTTEYSLLEESTQHPFKSQEYFDKRRQAFSYRKECAIKLINAWVKKYGSVENCPVKYSDTLIIPFQKIEEPK